MVWETKTNMLLLNVKSDILDYVIDKVQDTLETLVDYTIYQYKKKFVEIDEYEKEWIRLHIERDMISTFETCTKSTDTLIDFKVTGDVNSIITFECIIRRDNKDYMFNTNIIWTGLKWRNNYFNYLSKSTLDNINRKDMTDRYNKRILYLENRKNLENKIYFTELNWNRVKCNILVAESKSKGEIIRSQKQEWHDMRALTWKQAIELGLDLAYESESEFNLIKEKSVDYALEKFREFHIKRPREIVDVLESELKILKDKLKTLPK